MHCSFAETINKAEIYSKETYFVKKLFNDYTFDLHPKGSLK